MRVWRISKRQYAPAAFSGNGGLRAAMRWNHKCHRIVYTSQSLSLATLELWVHTPPIEPLTTYVSVAAGIPDELQINVFDQEVLPRGWQEDPAPRFCATWARVGWYPRFQPWLGCPLQ